MGDAGVELLARALRVNYWLTALYLQVRIRQQAYVCIRHSIRQQTTAYLVSIRPSQPLAHCALSSRPPYLNTALKAP